jgi:hypothetical protein
MTRAQRTSSMDWVASMHLMDSVGDALSECARAPNLVSDSVPLSLCGSIPMKHVG